MTDLASYGPVPPRRLKWYFIRLSFRTTFLPSPENRAFVTDDAEVGHRTMYGLDFGESQRVELRRGTTYVREAAPTEQFWRAWRQNKDAVKAAGFSLRKFHDEWSVRYWSDSEDCPLPKTLP